MAEHVVIRDLAVLRGDTEHPQVCVAFETRDRPGPAYKAGIYEDDEVWIQLHGGLFVARAEVRIAFRGEYSKIDEVKRRVADQGLPDAIWEGRPRAGYCIVAWLHKERWIEPFWAGPRTYQYEWIVLEDAKKRTAWLDPKDPPRTGATDLRERFARARAGAFAVA